MSTLTSAISGQSGLAGTKAGAINSRFATCFAELVMESSWDLKPATYGANGAGGSRRQVLDPTGGHLLPI